ncbi:alpha/beta hydrolase family protein [Rhodovarius lipocyclicus]|uniref:alpha/beta hydrolase family protein n=1 Tax=Rhodovarius lipocyclicus TaxID=268410 RepID=UPI001916F245|nr:CocE/NonD family hydrolase [Rhodovarius lipocyclicus]
MRALTLLFLLAACAPGALSAADGEMLPIPVTQANGSQVEIQARLCLPEGGARRPLVLINHGSPPNAARRPSMTPASCQAEAVRFFLARGHAVAMPMRRGYGPSGGNWAEGFGPCNAPDYVRAGLEAARDMRAAIATLAARPDVPAGPVLVVGQSAGGWGTIALASRNPPEVAGYVNMAGGRGGHVDNIPNLNCAPDRLVEAAGRYGATARASMLWVYTANDSYFAPELARRMHAAFTAAGGQARFVAAAPFGTDGHGLFFGRGGSAIWGPLVTEAFP